MKFSCREDIAAPIETVFDRLADFAAHERAAMSRGVEVERLDTLPRPGPGMRWQLKLSYRGISRDVMAEITGFEPSRALVCTAEGGSFHAVLGFELVALSPRRTRMVAGLEIRPKGLTARLMLQSLRLTRKRYDEKFAARIRVLAEQIGSRAATG